MALRLVSFAGGELAAAAQTAGGGHILSRSSNLAARQISRQTGGRLTLAGLVSRSAMTRPISSSRSAFPTQVLASTVRSGASSPGSDGSRLALSSGTSVGAPTAPHPSESPGSCAAIPVDKRRAPQHLPRQAPLEEAERRALPNASAPGPASPTSETPATKNRPSEGRYSSCLRIRAPSRPSSSLDTSVAASSWAQVVPVADPRRGSVSGHRGVSQCWAGRPIRLRTDVARAHAARTAAVLTHSLPGMGETDRFVLLPMRRQARPVSSPGPQRHSLLGGWPSRAVWATWRSEQRPAASALSSTAAARRRSLYCGAVRGRLRSWTRTTRHGPCRPGPVFRPAWPNVRASPESPSRTTPCRIRRRPSGTSTSNADAGRSW